ESLWNAAVIARASGRREDARALLAEATTLVDALRGGRAGSSGRAAMQAGLSPLHEERVAVALELSEAAPTPDHLSELFDAVTRAKARAFLDRMQEAPRVARAAPAAAALVVRERELSDRIDEQVRRGDPQRPP